MKKLLVSLATIATVLLVATGASAADLQPQASIGANNANPIGSSSSANSGSLQPASSYSDQGVNSGGLNDAELLNSSAPASQPLGTGVSQQEIMSEADPNPVANGSSNWLEIILFVILGLAIILSGYFMIRSFASRRPQLEETES